MFMEKIGTKQEEYEQQIMDFKSRLDTNKIFVKQVEEISKEVEALKQVKARKITGS